MACLPVDDELQCSTEDEAGTQPTQSRGRALLYCTLGALALGGFHAWTVAGGIVDGTVPLLHLGLAHGYTTADIPDLSGRVAIVTGATSGLGLGCARSLQKARATLIVTARTPAKCKTLVAGLADLDPSLSPPRCVAMELLSLPSVRDAAAAVADLLPGGKIDYLVLNAGIMNPPQLTLSEQGLESQFATNHLGHFRLFELLRPRLSGGRVVSVSSIAHWIAPSTPLLSVAQLNNNASYFPVTWYVRPDP